MKHRFLAFLFALVPLLAHSAIYLPYQPTNGTNALITGTAPMRASNAWNFTGGLFVNGIDITGSGVGISGDGVTNIAREIVQGWASYPAAGDVVMSSNALRWVIVDTNSNLTVSGADIWTNANGIYIPEGQTYRWKKVGATNIQMFAFDTGSIDEGGNGYWYWILREVTGAVPGRTYWVSNAGDREWVDDSALPYTTNLLAPIAANLCVWRHYTNASETATVSSTSVITSSLVVDALGNAQFDGILTAESFTGNGATLTNLPGSVRGTNGLVVSGVTNGTASASATSAAVLSLPPGAIVGGLYVWNGTNMVALSTSGLRANFGGSSATNIGTLTLGTGTAVISNSASLVAFPNGISVEGSSKLGGNAAALALNGLFFYSASQSAFTDSGGQNMIAQGRRLLDTAGGVVVNFSNRTEWARHSLTAWTNTLPTASSSVAWGPGFWATNGVAGTNYFAVSVASNSWIFTPYFVLP